MLHAATSPSYIEITPLPSRCDRSQPPPAPLLTWTMDNAAGSDGRRTRDRNTRTPFTCQPFGLFVDDWDRVQAEADIFGSTGSDRSIALYDLRHSTPIRKIVMQTNCNALAWNPMEPLNFVVASEDCNLYTYDMRKLDTATCVHEVRALCPTCWCEYNYGILP